MSRRDLGDPSLSRFPKGEWGGRDLEIARGPGWGGGVGEEQGRSCPTVGNNRGAAFRPGVREEAGCWQGKRGGEPGGPNPHPTSYPWSAGGGGGFCRETQNGGGADGCHWPAQPSSPQGTPSLEISDLKSWISSCCLKLGTQSPGVGWGH